MLYYGLDGLGAAMYQAAYVKALPSKWAHGGFAEEFGNFYPVAERCLAKGSPLGRYQLIWSHKNHQFGDADIPTIVRLCKQYNKLALAHKDQDIELSPFCEHELKAPDKYLQIAKENAPDCVIVNCPDAKGAFSTRFKNEVHGGATHPLTGPYNYSADGGFTVHGLPRDLVDYDVTNLKLRHQLADVFFIWAAGLNCHWGITEKARTFKPDATYLQSLIYLADFKGVTSIPPDWIIKSHAEASPGNTRSNKLMIISPVRASKITLKRDGKVVTNLNYYGPYSDGKRFRYYSANYGFKSGAECTVWANGHKYGIINGGFREN